MRRIFDFISYPSHSRTIGFLAFLVVLLAVPLTVNIAQKQQELRQHAAFTTCDRGSLGDDGNCYDNPATKTGFDGPATATEGGSGTSGGVYNGTCYTADEATKHPECQDTGGVCGPNSDGVTRHVYNCPFCLFGVVGNCSNSPNTNTTSGGVSLAPGCYKDGTQPSGCTPGGNNCPNNSGFAGFRSFICSPSSGGTTTADNCTSQGYSCDLHSTSVCEGEGGRIVGAQCGNGNVCCKLPGAGGVTGKPCGNQGGTCRGDVCVVGPTQETIDANGSVDCKTGGGSSSACSAPYSGPCVAPNNFAGARQEPNCTRSSGASGKSVTVCQQVGSSLCWYDQYTDNTKTQAERDAGCYVTATGSGGGTGTGGSGACDASCTATNGKLCQNNQCTDIPNQIACSTTPTCPSGTSLFSFPNSKYACLTGTNTWSNPNCPGATGTGGTGTQITFVVGLDGIGQTGDQKNPNPQPISNQSRGSNQSPKKTQRTFFYQVFDASGTTEQANGQGTIGYDSAKGKFTAGATLNKTLADGTYLLKVRVQGFLAKIVRGVTISGGVAQVPNTNLVNGDTNGDNHLKIDDYNLILSCAFKPMTSACAPADLDDNGVVDQFDYNLFVREFAVVQDGE